MKKFGFFPVFMCLLATCFLTACSDDDENGEDGGSSHVEACYFESRGERIDFKYAYYYVEDIDEITATFTTIDILDYYYHPEKLKPGTYLASLDIDFTGDNQFPLGKIESEWNKPGSGFDEDEKNFDMEVDTKWDLYEVWVNGGDDSASLWYSIYWNEDKPSVMVVSKVANGYKMETEELYLRYDAGDEGIDEESPKCTGKFYFQGSLKDASDLEIGEEGVSVRAVQVTDKDQIAFLKSLRRNK